VSLVRGEPESMGGLLADILLGAISLRNPLLSGDSDPGVVATDAREGWGNPEAEVPAGIEEVLELSG